jgi:hypothetical protein
MQLRDTDATSATGIAKDLFASGDVFDRRRGA